MLCQRQEGGGKLYFGGTPNKVECRSKVSTRKIRSVFFSLSNKVWWDKNCNSKRSEEDWQRAVRNLLWLIEKTIMTVYQQDDWTYECWPQ